MSKSPVIKNSIYIYNKDIENELPNQLILFPLYSSSEKNEQIGGGVIGGEPTENDPALTNPIKNKVTSHQYTMDFLSFWKIHPYGSKSKAFIQYKKLKHLLPDNALQILKDQLIYSQGSTREDFRPSLPHLERWFRHRRWEDELPPTFQSSSSLPVN